MKKKKTNKHRLKQTLLKLIKKEFLLFFLKKKKILNNILDTEEDDNWMANQKIKPIGVLIKKKRKRVTTSNILKHSLVWGQRQTLIIFI